MEAAAIESAKRNVDAWSKEIAKGPIDAILINASGCGTTVKDYGHLLARDPDYAERAAQVSALPRTCRSSWRTHDIGAPQRWTSLKVAYHSACSMQHGQRITREPKALLKKAGYSVLDIPEGHLCCGSAGVYNILQSKIAGQLLERKAGHIKALRPDLVATGNIGCISPDSRNGTRYPGRPYGRAARLVVRRPGAARHGGARAVFDARCLQPPNARVDDYIRA